LLLGGIVPEVWVPPAHMRELRAFISYRNRLEVIVVIARKLLVAIWRVLSKEETDEHASEEDLAYKMLLVSAIFAKQTGMVHNWVTLFWVSIQKNGRFSLSICHFEPVCPRSRKIIGTMCALGSVATSCP
jgi:hypothetical protein